MRLRLLTATIALSTVALAGCIPVDLPFGGNVSTGGSGSTSPAPTESSAPSDEASDPTDPAVEDESGASELPSDPALGTQEPEAEPSADATPDETSDSASESSTPSAQPSASATPTSAPSSTPPAATAPATTSTAAVRLPPVGAIFDYQLGGGYRPPAGVSVVARDATEAPAAGTYGICYVNGFQTQPDRSSWWLEHYPNLVLHVDGEPFVDEGWPDEYLLDTSTAANRAAIARVLTPTIRSCATAGYSAVEFDNLDSFTRSDGELTANGAMDMAARLIAVAHANGLAAAQKNAAELTARGHSAGFDFAVAEECHRWDECSEYTDVYGAHVLDIEYNDDLRGSWASVCADSDTPDSTILRDRDLVPAGEHGYVYKHC